MHTPDSNPTPTKRAPRRARRVRAKRRALYLSCALVLTACAVCTIWLFANRSAPPVYPGADTGIIETAPTPVRALRNPDRVDAPDWVDVQLLDAGTSARNGKALDVCQSVVVHYVANPGTTAQQNRNYFNNPGTQVSAHFVVGLHGEVIQCVPLTEQSSASNHRNADSIAIEVCHPDESGEFSKETYASLVRLTAWLCDLYGFGEGKLIRHYDITGKPCPLYFVEHEDAWAAFKGDVMAG